MDKQQAAHEYARNRVYDKNPADIAVESHIAGWEAHEAQCPSDAVAQANKIAAILESTYNKHSPGPHFDYAGFGVECVVNLLSLFNPSGAATQPDPKCECCQGKGFLTVKEKQPDGTYRMECPYCEARNDAMEETLGQSSAPQEEKYPIGGYAPGNYTCLCVTCEKQFMGDKRALQCEPCAVKMTANAAAPQASGPVWVKGIERVPVKGPSSMGLHIKIEGTASTGRYSHHHEMFINDGGDFFPPDQVQWLDESPRQVFPREVLERMLLDLARDMRAGKVVTLQDVTDWFNTNYPPSK